MTLKILRGIGQANLGSILKSRDITLPTKVCLIKVMVFPVVMYGCEGWTIKKAAAAAAKSHQSCPTLCNPMTAAHQAPLSLGFSRQEHWSGLPFPSPMHACVLSRFSHVRPCATLWAAAHQAPLTMGFSRQEHWSGLPFPSP